MHHLPGHKRVHERGMYLSLLETVTQSHVFAVRAAKHVALISTSSSQVD